ncbi:MAG: xanthine dehydrogenase family protein molybdopterin-binding subunit, partial [Ilumatobacteraceae bacterium]
MTDEPISPRLFGARVLRVEDKRLLTGRGRFVADIAVDRMLTAKFVRADVANGVLAAVDAAVALGMDGVHAVFTGGDFADHEIRCNSSYEGFQSSGQPILAVDRVRFVGEAVAMVVADDEYVAEDACETVVVDIEPLAPVLTRDQALANDASPLHPGWIDNAYVRRALKSPGFDQAVAGSKHHITLQLTNGRHGAIPIENRACIADYDSGSGVFKVFVTTQIPHLVKAGLSLALGVPESAIHVVSPDVGGGFGVKAQLYVEDVACCLAARALGRPIKWVEDRREHFVASHHSREHYHTVTAHFDDDGVVEALEADVAVDMGAYSVFPWTATMDNGMAMGILPGPYRIHHYAATGTPYCTNKTPYGAYRGVARPAACFSIERLMDQIARHRALDRVEVRRRNLLRGNDYPWSSPSGLVYDSGSLIESMDKVLELADYDALLDTQARARTERRLFGIGLVAFTEQTAHSTQEFKLRGVPIVFGYETVRVRMDASGTAVVSASIHDHGQGLETTLAQITADRLGLAIDDVRVQYGDTDSVAYGSGTFASRSAVLAGGAATKAADVVAAVLREVAAHCLEAS